MELRSILDFGLRIADLKSSPNKSEIRNPKSKILLYLCKEIPNYE